MWFFISSRIGFDWGAEKRKTHVIDSKKENRLKVDIRQPLLGKQITGSVSIVLSVFDKGRFEENSRTSQIPLPHVSKPFANAYKNKYTNEGKTPPKPGFLFS